MAEDYTLIDHTDEVLEAIHSFFDGALEKCGMLAEGYAKENITDQKAVDTGALRNSITYKVVGKDCYVGTNIEYAPYVEFGTGLYYPGGGRRTPWVYKDAEGVGHKTSGMKPRPYLKPAVADHINEYRAILHNE